MFRRTLLIVFLIMLVISNNRLLAQQDKSSKLQVYILAGQSNMVGHANIITIPNLLADPQPEVQALGRLVFKDGMTVSREVVDKQIAAKIARDQLQNDLRSNQIAGEQRIAAARQELDELSSDLKEKSDAIRAAFAVSDQVYITSIADRNRRTGRLTVGFGANEDKIGPELGFGMSLAERTEAPILLIKASWGGKSLHYDFRPPSSGPYELSEKEAASDKADEIRSQAGAHYRLLMERVETVLADVGSHHPLYDPTVGYDLAGFVWFQGFNDQFSDPFRDNYKNNMIAFIKDVRSQLDAPSLPFVIGVLGTGITAEKVDQNPVSLGQRAAATDPRLDLVTAVESYQLYDLAALEVFNKGWQQHLAEWIAVGSDRPYHYLGSGKFFIRLGNAFADAIVDLQKERKKAP